MKKRRLFLLMLAAALLAQALGTSSAGAVSLKTNVSGVRIEGLEGPGRLELISPLVTFAEPFGGTAVCEVTLKGTVRTGLILITQTTGAFTRLGSLTEGRVNRCSQGGATLLTETLPWEKGFVYGTDGVLLDGTTQVGIRGTIRQINIRVRTTTSFECLVRNGTVSFLYDNRGSLDIGVSFPNSNLCGGLGNGEMKGVFIVKPTTLRVFALLF